MRVFLDLLRFGKFSAKKLEILHATEQMIQAINNGSFETYSRMCTSDHTCFDPMSMGNLIRGHDLHRFHFACKLMYCICIFFIIGCIFILLSRESDQCAITSWLRVFGPPVYHTKTGNPLSAFPSCTTSELAGRLVLHAVPLMLSIKWGSSEYQF